MSTATYGLEKLGFKKFGKLYRNLPVEKLVEHQIFNKEGVIGPNGSVIVSTGKFTGRSPKDKFFVDEKESTDNLWWGPVNAKITLEVFEKLQSRVVDFLSGSDLYLFDGYCGAEKKYRMPIRIVTKKAWHSHFVRNMFIRPKQDDLESFTPEFTILNASGYFEKEFKELGLNSEVFIIFDLTKKLAIIGGTEYGGEMKKGIFSVMNYYLPLQKVMSMHCSANVGKEGDVALFFGLSGTGKTTLSADPDRMLIGDDEHGWSDDGIFNLEGGCYAKCVKLDPKKEPDIWNAIRFEAILENVVYDENRVVDYNDVSKTENTRVSYPLHSIPNSLIPSKSGHPKNIIFLTCDAFGVLPPVMRLSPEQASYHFLSGYTAKIAGTERGVTEPEATFSACFGAPFLTLNPEVYAKLLTDKMNQHGVMAYLVNTGWTGGPYGIGHRMHLSDTRKIITAILDGSINNSEWERGTIFRAGIPKSLAGVNSWLLRPRNTWSTPEEYDKTRIKLAEMFIQNFKKYEKSAPELVDAGPKID
ncbi:MAG: phosphoenolpyruvate carboxykinase (ATP) [Deltaproteobacteria bacterium]|nr:phosphoenolpyruvate carboxykinase (ATP) [Deltaproteobacteria bacterium]